MRSREYLPAYALRHRRRRTVFVAYDVATNTPGGPRRLRAAARACEACGRRVNWSVFSCRLTPTELTALRATLLGILDVQTDRLLIVPVRGGDEEGVEKVDPTIESETPTVVEV